ncbi:MAG: ABC transporter substrate-binding protein [Candidatus Hermodarchaeota archaeon]
MKKIKTLLIILAVFGMIFSLSVNVAAPVKAETKQAVKVKIGALGPLDITPGKDMKAGFDFAVEEINAAGGFEAGGTTYEFDPYVESNSGSDGLPDPQEAATALTKLQDQEDVVAIVGGFRTEVVAAIMGDMDRPFLGVGSTVPITNPYFWRVGPANGTTLTRGFLDLYALGLGLKLGVRNVTIVREDVEWTVSMATAIKGFLHYDPYGMGFPKLNFTSDIKIPQAASQEAVTSALTPLQGEYEGYNVNALCTIFSAPVGRYVTIAWAGLDLPQYLAGINVESQASTYFDELEGACYGEIEGQTDAPDLNQTSKTGPFRAAYQAKEGELPTYTAFASYDAVYVIKDAIERAGSIDPEDIQTALETTDYLGTVYKIKFTSEENQTNAGASPTIVHDLWTSATINHDARPYYQGYYCQWQKGGVKKTVFLGQFRDIDVRAIPAPINHSDHGWTPPVTTPSFELPVVVFSIVFIAAIALNFKKRKRKVP